MKCSGRGGMDRNDPRYQEFLDNRRSSAGISDDNRAKLSELPPEQANMLAQTLGSHEPNFNDDIGALESELRPPDTPLTPPGLDDPPSDWDFMDFGQRALFRQSKDKGAWMRGYSEGLRDSTHPLKGEFDQWQRTPHKNLVRMKGKSYASGYREGLNTFSPKG